MKTILKSLLAACLLAFSAAAAHAQPSIGAGYNNVVMFGGEGETEPLDIPLHGFYIEADYNLRLWKGLGVAPGLQYEFVNGNIDEGMNFQEHYLNIPIDINYIFRISDNFGLGVFLTPSFNIGLVSQIKYGNEKLDIYDFLGQVGEVFDIDKPYSRFDFMLGFGVSVDLFRHFRVKINYDLGLVNRLSRINRHEGTDTIEKITMRRNHLQIGLAYIF